MHLFTTHDEITVHFDIVYAAEVIDTDSGKRIYGSDATARHGEQWIFMRAKGVQTPVSGSLLEEHCARCHAALNPQDPTRCSHCGANIAFGETDWIAQSREASSYEQL